MTSPHEPAPRSFASDNYAGIHPEVLEAIARANTDHQIAYGDDAYTARCAELFREQFGPDTEVFPVFNGTGANVTGLQSMLPRWGAVIAAETAHINVDEGGAPERVGGIKILSVPTPDGKLTPELIDREAWGFGDEHRAQPAVVSITQSTELGTVYTPAEIRAIADHIYPLGMRLHMDGARIANAAAHLNLPLRAFTSDAGVDVLSFGGTKTGAMGAEAIVVVNPDAAEGLRYLRKMNMQLGSKMRFLSAQLNALLEGELFLRTAGHANAMATRLRAGIEAGQASGALGEVTLLHPTEANAVFASLPARIAEPLRRRFRFYDWPGSPGTARWMCSFDTTPADVDAFLAELERLSALP